MKLKEDIKKEIDKMDINSLVFISEQIKFINKLKFHSQNNYPIDEVRKLTSASKSNWAEEVIKEREERN